MSSLRAASDARRSSAAIFASTTLIEPQLTAEPGDLVLNLGQSSQVVAVAKRVSGVFQCPKQLQGLLKVVRNPTRGLDGRAHFDV